jgi:putative membrane protein
MLLACATAYIVTSLPSSYGQSIVFEKGAEKMMRSTDIQFALNAAQVMSGEMQLAELALQQASNPAVKELAHHLREENQKMREDLERAAAEQMLKLPENATQQIILQRHRLLRLSGQAFEAAWIKDLLTDTRESIQSSRREASKGKDSGMKSFAVNTLPLLEARLGALEQLGIYKQSNREPRGKQN